MEPSQRQFFEFEGFVLDTAARRLTGPDGAAIEIKPRVFDTLTAMLERSGEVIDKHALMDVVWPGVVVEENNLSQAISALRKALSEAAPEKTFIVTVPGRGYQFTARVERRDEGGPAQASPAPTSAAQENLAPPETRAATQTEVQAEAPAAAPFASWLARAMRYRWPVLAAGLAIALIAVVGPIVLRGDRGAVADGVNAPRIAIVPFEAAGGERAEAIARVAPSTIADVLQQAGETVLSPRFAAGEDRAGATAREFAAAYLLEGDAAQTASQMILTVRVVNVDGEVIWSRQMPEPIERGDLLPDQAAIVVADVFRWLRGLPFTGPNIGETQMARLRPVNRFRQGDPLAAYDEARRAIAESPDEGLPRITAVWLARVSLHLFPPAERQSVIDTMLEDARLAERLAADNPAIWTARVNALPPSSFVERGEVLARGVAAEPDNPEMRNYMAGHLLGTGRIAAAESFARQSAAIDPVSPAKAATPVIVLAQSGRFAEALRESDGVLARWPDQEFVLREKFTALTALGDYGAARALLDDAEASDAIDPPAEVQPARVLLDAFETPSPATEEALVRACERPHRLSQAGENWCLAGLASLGRLDEAFALTDVLMPQKWSPDPEERYRLWMEDPPTGHLVWRLYSPSTATMRADPRIIPVFERLGLAHYWRETGEWPDFCENEPGSICDQMRAL